MCVEAILARAAQGRGRALRCPAELAGELHHGTERLEVLVHAELHVATPGLVGSSHAKLARRNQRAHDAFELGEPRLVEHGLVIQSQDPRELLGRERR